MIYKRNNVIVTESNTPTWVGWLVMVLVVTSILSLGMAWSATSHTKRLDQAINRQTQVDKQNAYTVAQRLAKAEERNAQLRAELAAVADKMNLTQAELTGPRAQTAKQVQQLKAENEKRLADLTNAINGEIAGKASVDDMNKLGTDVTGVRSDLEATKNNLNMTRGEFGALIAKNHDEIEGLRRLGQRDYYEFTIDKKNRPEKVGELMVELRGTNPKRNQYNVAILVDDQRHEKKKLIANEPLYVFSNGGRVRLEFVVNKVGKNKIAGYLSVPKANAT